MEHQEYVRRTHGLQLVVITTNETPKSGLLAADTGMGAVTLRVGDLDGMIRYYRDGVTLELLSHDGPVAVLGRGTTPLLILEHAPELKHASPSSAACSTPPCSSTRPRRSPPPCTRWRRSTRNRSPAAPTTSSARPSTSTTPRATASSCTVDRDRSKWSWVHGQVEMATLFLDPNEYLREHLTEAGANAAATGAAVGDAIIGHVHLSVGDVESAREFYVDRLGFEQTTTYGSQALFVSAGGYHHHMAMNTWNSRGAGRRQLALGLGKVEIVVPTADDLGQLGERMSHHRVPTRDDGRTLAFDDPWSNLVEVRAAERRVAPVSGRAPRAARRA